uniref:Uncharacterized protein n=1 Tax=Streptomyces ficellus TaxID=1977088 RepID=A0A1W5T2H9_9ACTN|nr:hypothetical protein [Streptomyces ficellus]
MTRTGCGGMKGGGMGVGGGVKGGRVALPGVGMTAYGAEDTAPITGA